VEDTSCTDQHYVITIDMNMWIGNVKVKQTDFLLESQIDINCARISTMFKSIQLHITVHSIYRLSALSIKFIASLMQLFHSDDVGTPQECPQSQSCMAD